ncbi:hypothetical protein SAMN02910292_01816 [Lachnospiraceae bacterium XBB2008]|nr:hypothetical protein [Lachnospiraceae bacterium]SCY49106.1 hypothetical protein SAMN02910292_01816 [Lachnospiraceae bacterium XBB2008]
MKKINTKKIAAVLTATLCIGVLAGCGSSKKADSYYFTNNTGATMQEVYVSSMSNDEWGDKLNDSTISNGKTITLSNSTLVDGVGASYDIGTIDTNGLNYDFYEVPINDQDTLSVGPANGDTVTLTVTSGSGQTTTYEGYAY